MNDTPETDAEHQTMPMGGFTLDFARKLERVRAEARETVKALTMTSFDLLDALEKARDERDRLTEALNKIQLVLVDGFDELKRIDEIANEALKQND